MFFKTHSFLGLFEVIYVIFTLFKNIHFVDDLQFSFVHPTVSCSFTLDNENLGNEKLMSSYTLICTLHESTSYSYIYFIEESSILAKEFFIKG